MGRIEPTDRTRIKRVSRLAVYDRVTIHAILDEALICHVGFVDQGHPYVIPTIPVRLGNRLYIHGSRASRMLRCLAAGAPACVNVTLLDGLVLARSALHHSMNYRSVVILATGDEVEDDSEKMRVFEALTEHVIPGRWDDLRRPSEQEAAATTLISFPIDEASAKIRTGPPIDEEEDYALPYWAGVIPLSLSAGKPIRDARLAEDVRTPAYAAAYRRPNRVNGK